MLIALGERDLAERYLGRARALHARWHEAYWMPEDDFYAMALGPDKQPVRSIASNPGHALAAGLVPPAYAERVADRLLAPDLFSGWGIRTLSSAHPSYNPLAYHLGTVWPVENATFALGFKRYGLDDRVERLVTALFSAAGHFRRFRLPEALGGHDRSESPLPTVYPESNCPQAWSASAIIQLVQAMLGLYPFAPARVLALVRPALPACVDHLEVRRIRVGDASVSIRFERQSNGTTAFDVIDKTGTLFVVEIPPPQDVRPERRAWADDLKAWFVEHAPGQTATALRIALGEWEL
jgi:glycogen debranching enzyme